MYTLKLETDMAAFRFRNIKERRYMNTLRTGYKFWIQNTRPAIPRRHYRNRMDRKTAPTIK